MLNKLDLQRQQHCIQIKYTTETQIIVLQYIITIPLYCTTVLMWHGIESDLTKLIIRHYLFSVPPVFDHQCKCKHGSFITGVLSAASAGPELSATLVQPSDK